MPVNESTVGPFLQNETDAAARKAFYVAYNNRGGDANVKLLEDAIATRDRLGHLMGYPDLGRVRARRQDGRHAGARRRLPVADRRRDSAQSAPRARRGRRAQGQPARPVGPNLLREPAAQDEVRRRPERDQAVLPRAARRRQRARHLPRAARREVHPRQRAGVAVAGAGLQRERRRVGQAARAVLPRLVSAARQVRPLRELPGDPAPRAARRHDPARGKRDRRQLAAARARQVRAAARTATSRRSSTSSATTWRRCSRTSRTRRSPTASAKTSSKRPRRCSRTGRGIRASSSASAPTSRRASRSPTS